VAWGGLGRYIIDGFATQNNVMVFAGGLLVALLAIVTELLLGALERRVVPTGIRRSDSEDVNQVAA
jgi:osmoprotectant transport system permease protein